MNDKKINIPKSYEEAILRKEEVLSLINEYNEAYFKGEQPNLSDDELALLQEEYQILSDIVIEKPIEKIEDSEIEEVKSRVNFLDKINPFIWIYAFFVLIFSSWFMIEFMGNEIFKFIFTKEWIKNYENKFLLQMVIFWSFYSFPLLIFLLNFLVKLFFRKNKLNNKAFWWFILVHFLYLILNFSFIYFDKLYPIIKEISRL